jgi:hypothetical protein
VSSKIQFGGLERVWASSKGARRATLVSVFALSGAVANLGCIFILCMSCLELVEGAGRAMHGLRSSISGIRLVIGPRSRMDQNALPLSFRGSLNTITGWNMTGRGEPNVIHLITRSV